MEPGKRNVVAAVIVMLCLGGIYAWSIFVQPLKTVYGFTTAQTQLIFGVLIAIFTVSMIMGNNLLYRYGPRIVVTFSGLLYLIGYIIASLSGGNFFILLISISIVAGIATGLGYLVSITVPVSFFPEKKGLITGLISAGFGAASVVLSYFVEFLFSYDIDVLKVFLIIGLVYGTFILFAAQKFSLPEQTMQSSQITRSYSFLKERMFYRYFFGILTGTFAGLLVIGNLKPIGAEYDIDNFYLLKGIALLSIANFTGRIFWGWLSDYLPGKYLIPLTLILIGFFTFLIGTISLTPLSYLLLALAIGFSFGANFTIYAKETAQFFGLGQMSQVYPYVFLGYGVSGILGPLTGGLIHDLYGNYNLASQIALMFCLITTVLMYTVLKERNKTT